MNWTKKSLQKQIKEMELGVRMQFDMLGVIEEFSHYKQVNSRFTNQLKYLGYHAYITKEKFGSTLYCSLTQITEDNNWNSYKAEFRYSLLNVFSESKRSFTWDGIKKEIERHDFVNRLQQAKDRAKVIDEEIEGVKELFNILKKKKFTCFDFYKGLYEIEDALREACE